jgi:hypothetical protein
MNPLRPVRELVIAALCLGCAEKGNLSVNQGGGASETIARVIICDTVPSVSIEGKIDGDYRVSLCAKTYFPVLDTGFTDSAILGRGAPFADFTQCKIGAYNIIVSSAADLKAVLFADISLAAFQHDTLIDTLRSMSSIAGHLYRTVNSLRTVPTGQWYAFIRGARYFASLDSTGYFRLDNMAAGALTMSFVNNSRNDYGRATDTTVNLAPGKQISGIEIIIP